MVPQVTRQPTAGLSFVASSAMADATTHSPVCLPIKAMPAGDSVLFGKAKAKKPIKSRLALRLLATVLPLMAMTTGCAALPFTEGGNNPSGQPTLSATQQPGGNDGLLPSTEATVEPSPVPSADPSPSSSSSPIVWVTPPGQEPTGTPSGTPSYTPTPPTEGSTDWQQPEPTPTPETPSTPPLSKADRSFAIVGDTGSGTSMQYAVADRLEQLHKETPFSNILMMGDNVLPDGEPHLFRERLYTPYKDLTKKGVKIRPVLGNHDVRAGYGDQQLKYWGVPRFYSTRVGPNGPGGMEFFGIDTTVLLPGVSKCYVDNPKLANKRAKAQIKWLKKALAESKVEYKIVYGHYPLYTSGWHGVKDAKALAKLRDILEPILQENGVDLYLSGHDHNYEHATPPGGVEYMVSGGGGSPVRPIQPDDKLKFKYSRKKAFSQLHTVLFTLTDKGLEYKVYGTKGAPLYKGMVDDSPPG